VTHSLLDSTPGLVPHDPEDWNKIRLVIADKYGYHTACKIQRRLRRWLGAEESANRGRSDASGEGRKPTLERAG